MMGLGRMMRHSLSIENPLRELISMNRDRDDSQYMGRDQGRYYLSLHTFSKMASKNREVARRW